MTDDRVTGLIGRVAAAGALTGDEPAALIYDLDALAARRDELVAAFPAAMHAIAVKACPLPGVLRELTDASLGLEAASGPELELALRLVPPERVVYDSPVKTRAEIERALGAGVGLHVDNWQELDRVDVEVAVRPGHGPIGLRVNTGVGGGRVAETSTAVPGSKFGVDLSFERERIVAAYRARPWMAALHGHTGSLGCSVELLVRGVSTLVALADEIGTITRLDIGGGLPVGPDAPTLADYAGALRIAVPALFDRPWQVVTEFGRAVFADTGIAVSRVEYTKHTGGRRIALVHFGADLFPRGVLRPDLMPLRISVRDPSGAPKHGPVAPWDLAGPLCFSGDLLAVQVSFPAIEAGDLVVVHDVGAYGLSMWSRYNSRRAPAVHGVRGDAVRLLKPAESTDDVLRFWG